MPRARKNSEGLLARVNFPLYAVHLLTSRYVIVGGGGGSAKTGVANAFEVYELSHNGKRFIAQEVFRHETGSEVVMNFACFNDGKRLYLAAGQESHCQLYNVSISVTKESAGTEHLNGEVDSNLRRRKGSRPERVEKLSPRADVGQRKINFSFSPSDSVQTDFNTGEAVQRVVQISRCGRLMATGGMDGHVRIWQFPSLRPHHEIKAHNREVDDIDFSHNSLMVVSVGKDGQTHIWCTKTGKKLQSLQWSPPNGTKYVYKKCRFGRVSEDAGRCRLFTVSNSVGRGTGATSFMHSWDPKTGSESKSVALEEHVSALAVRDDGMFLALGTMFTGSVHVFITFSLQRLLKVQNAHGMFVTGLEFLPVLGSELCSSSEASVLSISVDNKLCIHDIPYRRTLPPWMVIILIIICLLFTFIVCSYLGL